MTPIPASSIHPRKTIRAKTVLELTGYTAAGTRVYDARSQPMSTLPALIIRTDDDEFVEWRSINNDAHRRVTVEIECYVSDNSESTQSEECDTLCRQVEQRLDDLTSGLGGIALTHTYNSTAFAQNNDTDPPVMVGTIRYDVEYLDNFE